MKITEADMRKIIDFYFRCPYCNRLWILDNTQHNSADDQEYFDDLLCDRSTNIYTCKCGNHFHVKVKEGK